MDNKLTRYIFTIFTLDGNLHSTGITSWSSSSFDEFLLDEEKHYGLKLINTKEEVSVIVEYNNIIWNYCIYYGSYKKRFKKLVENDTRWQLIEKHLLRDLKVMGVEYLKEDILSALRNGSYFNLDIKKDIQFKKYCV